MTSAQRLVAIAATACAAALIPAAAAAGAPRPGKLVERAVHSTAPDANRIRQTYVRQYDPLPASVPAHPARCDWLGYLRLRHREGPRRPARGDAVLVAQPGNLAGASHMDIIARKVIRKAAARGRYIEFWSLDRRSNCIEDRRVIRAATRAHDHRVAVDYYFGNREIQGRRFAGFKTSDDLDYLAEFGLAQTVRDEQALIARRIPRRLRARKVFCGGHSHGGLITAAFAMWDFDGDPGTTRDAGYNQCAGYFGLETIVDLDPAGAGRTGLLGNLAGAAAHGATVAAIRSGVLPRNETSLAPITPETMLTVTLAGLAAYQEPDEETELLRLLPSDLPTESLLRGVFSRDAVAFATGQPRDFRLTNEALFGGLVDDNSQPFSFVQASVGTFDGGPVEEKNFPLPNLITGAMPSSPLLTLVGRNKLMVPAEPKEPLYTWRNYDRVGAPDAPRQVDSRGEPFTSPASEVVDVHQWARAWFGEGPPDLVEWYFPTRLLTDTVAAVAGARDGELSALQHPEGPRKRPTVTILGGESLGPSYEGNPGVYGEPPNRLVSIPGYNHADVTGPAWRQNDGKPERTTRALTGFVLKIVGAGK